MELNKIFPKFMSQYLDFQSIINLFIVNSCYPQNFNSHSQPPQIWFLGFVYMPWEIRMKQIRTTNISKSSVLDYILYSVNILLWAVTICYTETYIYLLII